MVQRAAQTEAGHTCKMCGERPADAKAHVYPRALYRDITTPDDPPISIPRDPAEREKVKRKGSYDSTILCRTCENRFQPYDDHAIKALRAQPVANGRWGSPGILELVGFDAGRLKLFFMHVLWRAHWSTQPEFDATNIGPRIDRLHQLLLADDPGGPNDFPVVLIRYDPDPDGLHNVFSAPRRYRWPMWPKSIVVDFQLALWVAMVTTSSTGLPHLYQVLSLTHTQPVPVLRSDQAFRHSSHLRQMVQVLKGRSEENTHTGRRRP